MYVRLTSDIRRSKRDMFGRWRPWRVRSNAAGVVRAPLGICVIEHAVHSHPPHFWMSISPTYRDMPMVMFFGAPGEQRNILSKGAPQYFRVLANANTSGQCHDAIQEGCHLEDLKGWAQRCGYSVGVEEVGEIRRRRRWGWSNYLQQFRHAGPGERQSSQVWHARGNQVSEGRWDFERLRFRHLVCFEVLQHKLPNQP